MTLEYLMDEVYVQGEIVLKKIVDDEIEVLYRTNTELTYTADIEPFVNMEVSYIYVNGIGELCIELRDEED